MTCLWVLSVLSVLFLCKSKMKDAKKGYAESMKNATKESKAGKETQGPSGSGGRAAVVRSQSFGEIDL